MIVTQRAAYFTDSPAAAVRAHRPPGRAGRARGGLPITGGVRLRPGFNANGIEATRDGRTLIPVNRATGELFTADARVGRDEEIDLGAATSSTATASLLKGRKLYVVRNRDNLVAVVKLRRDGGASSTSISPTPDFNVPTTIARSAGGCTWSTRGSAGETRTRRTRW